MTSHSKALIPFRTLQVVSDLHGVACFYGNHIPKTIEARGASTISDYTNLVNMGEQHINVDHSLYAPLIEMSVKPDDDQIGFLVATAALLANFVREGKGKEDFSWHWGAFVDEYRKAPDPVRAAIMNGFKRAQTLSITKKNVEPTLSDCITRSKKNLFDQLLPIAKAMTVEERNYVARADYGRNIDKHLDALNKVLDENDGFYPKGENWFPAEVAELISHVSGETGFIPCTALLLINSLNEGDKCDEAAFRWMGLHQYYNELPSELSKPINNAFRYLYETEEYWDPFWDWSDKKLSKTIVTIRGIY